MVSYTIGNGRVKVKMAENVDKIRRYVYTRWEDTGFPMRVNHAVTSYMDIHGRGFVYSLGGFKGKGKVIPRGGGYEQWPDLGRVPMDVVELDIGIHSIFTRTFVCKSLKRCHKIVDVVCNHDNSYQL